MSGRTLIHFFIIFLGLFFGPLGWADPAPVFKAEFFSYQGPLRLAAGTHSFARFSKVENGVVTEVVDISWMAAPESLRRNNRMPLLREVAGQNYSLEETFAMAGRKNVTSHGEYHITPELFEAARKRKFDLEVNRYAYKLIDGRSQNGINCIHAVSGVLGYLNTGLKRGAGASASLVDFFLASGHMAATPISSSPAEAVATPALTPHATLPAAAPQTPAVTLAVPATHGPSFAAPVSSVPSAAPRPIFSRFRRR